MASNLMLKKISLYRKLLRMLSDKEINYSEFTEAISFIDKAVDFSSLNYICDKFGICEEENVSEQEDLAPDWG